MDSEIVCLAARALTSVVALERELLSAGLASAQRLNQVALAKAALTGALNFLVWHSDRPLLTDCRVAASSDTATIRTLTLSH